MLSSRSKRQRQARKSAAAGLLLFLWIATATFAAVPQLHALLHKDAQGADHSCVFTQVGQGSLLPHGPAVAAPAPPILCIGLLDPCYCELLPSFDYSVSDGRAPPAFSSSTAVVG
jgi:hypothetical protein